MSTTKERGILMHARSVQNILAGRKTQTRRIVKPQHMRPMRGVVPKRELSDPNGFEVVKQNGVFYAYTAGKYNARLAELRCPQGQPGDRLWVRETWSTLKEFDDLPPRDIPEHADVWYAEDGSTSGDRVVAGRTRPGLFMPRWASRITLEITDVRVERVQDISEDDALAEGLNPSNRDELFSARPQFARLWDDTNGAGAWDRNDWVWALTFKRVETAHAARR